jgi:hypothetical protein
MYQTAIYTQQTLFCTYKTLSLDSTWIKQWNKHISLQNDYFIFMNSTKKREKIIWIM